VNAPGRPAAPRPPLFRDAAVAAHAEASGPGRAVPSSRRLLRTASLALAVVVALGVGAASAYDVRETASGTWSAVPGDDVAVLHVPAGALPRLRAGQAVRTRGPGVQRGRVVTAEAAQDGAATVAEVRVALDTRATGTGGRATVELGRRSLLSLVQSVFDRSSDA
jgi:hypothetical protein